MLKSRFLIYFYLLSVAFLASCKKDAEMSTNFNGKTILSIQSDTIFLEGDLRISLNGDSISKIFYLVRHAEKDTSIAGDPPLTQAGYDRAAKLADILRGTRVDAIYTTMTLRTMYTADSLADIKAMKLYPYDNKTLKDIISSIKDDEDINRVLIVGHQNTVPAITNTLSGEDIFTNIFDDEDYGNFIIVILNKSGQPTVYTLRY